MLVRRPNTMDHRAQDRIQHILWHEIKIEIKLETRKFHLHQWDNKIEEVKFHLKQVSEDKQLDDQMTMATTLTKDTHHLHNLLRAMRLEIVLQQLNIDRQAPFKAHRLTQEQIHVPLNNTLQPI